jgi:hypothetical protein
LTSLACVVGAQNVRIRNGARFDQISAQSTRSAAMRAAVNTWADYAA